MTERQFDPIPDDQLFYIRLQHTNWQLTNALQELGVVKKQLKEAQNALQAIKADNRKLREQQKGEQHV